MLRPRACSRENGSSVTTFSLRDGLVRLDSRSNRWRFTFGSKRAKQEIVFAAVEADNDFISPYQGRRREAVELLRQNTEIVGIAADVTLFEGYVMRNQKFSGGPARSAAGFRIEMIRHGNFADRPALLYQI